MVSQHRFVLEASMVEIAGSRSSSGLLFNSFGGVVPFFWAFFFTFCGGVVLCCTPGGYIKPLGGADPYFWGFVHVLLAVFFHAVYQDGIQLSC